MRMRFNPHARPELAAWPYCVNDAAAFYGNWRSAFSRPELPLRVEFGCGKGAFLAQAALRDSDSNHLGIDLKSEMLVLAKRKIETLYRQSLRPLGNVLICAYDIERIDKVLAKDDAAERLYINFCNPWHKSGYAKHRLTHPRQLLKVRDFLAENGELWFKTDDLQLFNATLRYFAIAGFSVVWQTEDLHADEPWWNIRTEHENMFAAEGIAIKGCIAKKCPAPLDKASIEKMKNI